MGGSWIKKSLYSEMQNLNIKSICLYPHYCTLHFKIIFGVRKKHQIEAKRSWFNFLFYAILNMLFNVLEFNSANWES